MKIEKPSKKSVINELTGYVFMLLGCVAYAMATSMFLQPRLIVAGGVSGLSVLINDLYPSIDVGTLFIFINVPILLIGIKMQGWKFIFRCLVTTVVLGLFTNLFARFPLETEDGMLSALYGGICQGIGIGLFVRYQFSSGGTELLGRIISKGIKRLSIPVCVGILDGIIVVVGAIVTKTPANMLYALIVIFVSTKISEIILVGLEKSKLCIIISDKGEEIAEHLIAKSPRGITMLDGEGMYTHRDRNVLLTCVKNNQLMQVKEIVKEVDEKAFIIINESVEVRGQGFKSLNEDK